MKASELMIGDLVQTKFECPFKVLVLGCGTISDNLEEDVIPIPLTEEILKANGFKDYGDIQEYHFEEDGEKYHVYLRAMYNKENVRDAWGTNILGVLPSLIMYVHELQHALRLCGINDLADNFKVE